METVKADIYKDSVLGLIPRDWDVKLLPEVFDYIHGKAHEQYINKNGKFIVVNSKFISTEGSVIKKSEENFCPAKTGDILTVLSDLPNGKALAKTFYVDKDNKYAVNQRICIWRSKKDDSRFLSYIMNRNKYFLKYDDGVTQTHILNHHIEKCPVLVPRNKLEQKAIAQVLSDTDALIQALEKKIAKKKLIKKGVMQRLLTPKEGWVIKTLGEFLKYEQPTNYIVESTEYDDNYDIPVLTAGKSFVLGYTNEKQNVFENHPVIIFDDFTTASKYVDFPFKVKSSAMKILKLREGNVNLRFIYELMQQINFPLGDHKRHWIGEFQSIEVKVPDSEEEQNRIAQILSDMDREIANLEQKLSKYQLAKQGMMQQLLTGKIRLA